MPFMSSIMWARHRWTRQGMDDSHVGGLNGDTGDSRRDGRLTRGGRRDGGETSTGWATHVGGLNGDEEDDVVFSEGVPLVPHVHAVEVAQVKRYLGQHLGKGKGKGKGNHKDRKREREKQETERQTHTEGMGKCIGKEIEKRNGKRKTKRKRNRKWQRKGKGK